MSRSRPDDIHRARKYGRRHAVLRAMKSASELERVVQRLVEQLKASALPDAEKKRLVARLESSKDITRRREAIWAVVDALEAAEGG